MIGSTYSRFKTTVCSDCKDPFEDIDQCEVCEKPYCKDCQKYWKICADCGRMGCRCHFDGMYCKECKNDYSRL